MGNRQMVDTKIAHTIHRELQLTIRDGKLDLFTPIVISTFIPLENPPLVPEIPTPMVISDEALRALKAGRLE